jgi:hypothetical protein
MAKKPKVILTIAAALASFTAPSHQAEASAPPPQSAVSTPETSATSVARPDIVYTDGEDLLGLIVTKKADGTVVAQHASHVSHASHASHASHHSHFSSS